MFFQWPGATEIWGEEDSELEVCIPSVPSLGGYFGLVVSCSDGRSQLLSTGVQNAYPHPLRLRGDSLPFLSDAGVVTVATPISLRYHLVPDGFPYFSKESLYQNFFHSRFSGCHWFLARPLTGAGSAESSCIRVMTKHRKAKTVLPRAQT